MGLFFAGVVPSAKAQTPIWNWAKKSGGNGDEFGYNLVTDSAGNVYAEGTFNSASVQFGAYTLVRPAGSQIATYLVKYDPSGNVLWAKTFPTGVLDVHIGTLDRQGNLYVLATCYGAVTIGASNFNFPSGAQCIIKYTPNGTVRWVKSKGLGNLAAHLTQLNKLAAFDDTHLVALGSSIADTVDGIPVESSRWLALMDTAGQISSLKTLGGTGPFTPPSTQASIDFTGLAVDKSQHIYITGTNVSDSQIDSDNWQLPHIPDGGIQQAFIARFDGNLQFLWAKTRYSYINLGPEYAQVQSIDLAIDPQNNAYVLDLAQADTLVLDASHIYGTLPAAHTQALVKYAPDGSILWDTLIAYPTSPAVAITRGICTDRVGNLYYAGNFSGPLSFGGTDIWADGGSNLFVTKLDANGHVKWLQHNSLASLALFGNLQEDGHGNLYLTGKFYYSPAGQGDIGFGSTTMTAAVPSPSNTYAGDMYIAKLGNCQLTSPTLSPNTAQTLCAGDSVTFTASGAQEYLWSTGETESSIAVTTSGSYSVSSIATDGCYGTSSPVTVTIHTVDVAVAQSSAILTAHATNATYQWGMCTNNTFSPVSGANAQNYTATTSGSYAVIVTQNDCTDTSACYTVTLQPNGIEDASSTATDIVVFPNPNTGHFNVNITTDSNHPIVMTVLDLSGKKLLEKTVTGNAFTVDAEGLADGVYQVRFMDHGKLLKTVKMVLVK